VTEIWVCGDCRSVNGVKQSRCYRCHVPKSTGQMTEATAAISAANTQQTRTVLAQATRMGQKYRPTWLLAVLLIPLMVAATYLWITGTNSLLGLIDSNGLLTRDTVRIQGLLDQLTATGIAFTAALVVWSIWIAFVVANVPALTARWPPNGSLSALLAAWIPFICFKRPHTVVRGVLTTLTDGKPGPSLLALAWWLALLATYFLPTVALFVSRSPTVLGGLTTTHTFQVTLMVVSLVLAIGVVIVVEWEQHLALGRRADAVLGEAAAAPA
jgi:hypothetical protein